MKVEALLRAAVNMPVPASERAVSFAVAEQLSKRHAPDSLTYKAVEKWIERASIPGKWLMRVAALPKKPIDLTSYA